MAALMLALSIVLQPPPLLVRLSEPECPHFFDPGSRAELARALELQVDWFTRQERAAWPLGDEIVTAERLRATCRQMLDIVTGDSSRNLNLLIRERFDVYAVATPSDTGRARFTGYYNPVVDARLAPDSTYRYPLYRVPPNPRLTREQIETGGALDGMGLEIAWLRDPLDRYEAHIEGTASLLLPGDTTVNVQYAGANGYPYTSLGGALVRGSVLAPGTASMDSIRAVLERDPGRMQAWLNRNESYVFFRLTERPPAGCLGLPLVPERSIAADPSVFPPGLLCWAAVRVPGPDSAGRGRARFVLNQDKGAAIRGPHRVDLFWGTGPDAAAVAGRLNRDGRFYCLVAKRN